MNGDTRTLMDLVMHLAEAPSAAIWVKKYCPREPEEEQEVVDGCE